jgi:hypothetical protein
MRQTGRLSPQEFWARIDQGDARVRASLGVLPLFGVDRWTGPRMTGDWEWENDRLVKVGLVHGDRDRDGPFVHVQAVSGNPAEVAVGLRMRESSHPIGAEEFWTSRDRLAADPGTQIVVDVDGEPCEFRYWTGDAGWVAAAQHGDTGLLIEASAATDVAQVRLVRVTDIEPYIAGRHARLRRLRGEDA